MSDSGGNCPMPTPTGAHNDLLKAVGTWDVEGKFFMAPGAPPMDSKATEEVEAVGPFWVTGRFEGEMMGMPFHGRATVGYSPWTEEYESTWIDSMSPALIMMRGKMDGNVLTMEGDGRDPGTGNPVKYRTVETIEDNSRKFSMFLLGADGNDTRLFDMVYTRRV